MATKLEELKEQKKVINSRLKELDFERNILEDTKRNILDGIKAEKEREEAEKLAKENNAVLQLVGFKITDSKNNYTKNRKEYFCDFQDVTGKKYRLPVHVPLARDTGGVPKGPYRLIDGVAVPILDSLLSGYSPI